MDEGTRLCAAERTRPADGTDASLAPAELEDGGRYYDDMDELSPQQRLKRVIALGLCPRCVGSGPRRRVWTGLAVWTYRGSRLIRCAACEQEEALKRYVKFYHLKVDEESGKEDLAAQVARHFDMSLEVEEDDSIVAFMQRLRNGERTAVKRSTAREKERKALAAAEKAKRKSNSRKRGRERDHSVSVSTGRNTSNSSGHSTSNGNVGSNSSSHGHGNNQSSGSTNGHSGRGHASEGRKAPPHSNNPKSGTSSGGKGKKNKTEKETGEDNELYCICNLPSYGNMIACDGKTCPNPSQWYHLECVGLADGRHPDTWLCPECDPKGFSGGSSNSHKKKKNKRSKSPGNK
ncbi:unnamed protein product [Phytophthora fragariaefolia]|uniref:Unnamed protein product n=1 Tax=Phytophthora fragariaefolia TaxID=1490495 RepID=A0A9W6TNB0_9STRA|nr:unnamed protein product [Phytophthora fragariaefolia]